MNPFQSLRDYESFVYKLKQQFTIIQRSTLVVVPRGRRTAILQGELFFSGGYRLTVKERLSVDSGTVRIEFYGYEMWHQSNKFAWYDAQPHPNDPALASTHPHHKHILPDIKRNRVPAPDMSFERPNLPVLIAEFEELIEGEENDAQE